MLFDSKTRAIVMYRSYS